jgi:hypothetical protein
MFSSFFRRKYRLHSTPVGEFRPLIRHRAAAPGTPAAETLEPRLLLAATPPPFILAAWQQPATQWVGGTEVDLFKRWQDERHLNAMMAQPGAAANETGNGIQRMTDWSDAIEKTWATPGKDGLWMIREPMPKTTHDTHNSYDGQYDPAKDVKYVHLMGWLQPDESNTHYAYDSAPNQGTGWTWDHMRDYLNANATGPNSWKTQWANTGTATAPPPIYMTFSGDQLNQTHSHLPEFYAGVAGAADRVGSDWYPLNYRGSETKHPFKTAGTSGRVVKDISRGEAFIDYSKPGTLDGYADNRRSPGTDYQYIRENLGDDRTTTTVVEQPYRDKAFYTFIETMNFHSGGDNPDGRAPTAAEFRGQVWDAVINGARGIVYFTGFGFDGTTPEIADEMKVQNKRIVDLIPVIVSQRDPQGMSFDSDAVQVPQLQPADGGAALPAVPPKKVLHATWRTYQGYDYFIVENMSTIPVNSARFKLARPVAFTAASFNPNFDNPNSIENAGNNANSGWVIDDFGPYQTRVYAISRQDVTPPVIDPDHFENPPNDTRAAATDLGTLGDFLDQGLNIHAASDEDYYRLTTAGAGTLTVNIDFDRAEGDLDLQLLDASGGVLGTAAGTTAETLSRTVGSGEVYYVRVYGNGNINPHYTLSIDGPPNGVTPPPPPDRFEDNDSPATATRLGTLGDRTEMGLTVEAGDSDYFSVIGADNGVINLRLDFDRSLGDLDFELYAADGTTLVKTSSETTGNTETITADIDRGQLYFVRVYSRTGATHPDYDLTVDGPTAVRNAYQNIEAERYDAQTGIVNQGTYIGYVDRGDWLRYNRVDFGAAGTAGAGRFWVSIACPPTHAGNKIDVRLGSPTGEIIATHTVRATQTWGDFTAQSVATTRPVTGVQDVYLTFSGTLATTAIGNIDYFKFEQTPNRDARQTIEAESFNVANSDINGVVQVQNNGWYVSDTDNDDFIRFDNVDFGAGGFTSFMARVAVYDTHAGGHIQVWLDARNTTSGTLIADLTLPGTGGWSNFVTTAPVALTNAAAAVNRHNVYLVFKAPFNDVVNLDWLKFA